MVQVMKTFKQFLREDELTPEQMADLIIRDCSEYLRDTRRISSRAALYRGIQGNSQLFTEYGSRTSRITADMDDAMHDVLNNSFQKRFGHKFRTEAYFCTTGMNTARGYGELHLIFPSDGYSAIYSDIIVDAYPALSFKETEPELLETILEYYDKVDLLQKLRSSLGEDDEQYYYEFVNEWPEMVADWLKDTNPYHYVSDLSEVPRDHEIMVTSDKHYALKLVGSGAHFEVLDIIKERTGWGS